MEPPDRNVAENVVNDIHDQGCSTVITQPSHVAPFDVWSFDAASDVPPTRITKPRKKGKKKKLRIGKKKETEGTEMHRESTTSLSERNTLCHSVISIADASDRKCEWASCIQPESTHCPRAAQ